MPDTKISALTELTDLASTDEFVVVDKSDTTMGASGTTKRTRYGTLAAAAIGPRHTVGRWYQWPAASSISAQAVQQSEETLVPVWVDGGIDAIAVEVTTAAAGGVVVRLGVRGDDGSGLPSSLVLDAGTVPADSTGVKVITLGSRLDLPDGAYWLSATPQGAFVVMRVTQAFTIPWVGGYAGATPSPSVNHPCLYKSGITGALPDPLGAITGTRVDAPRISVRAA